MKRLKSCCFLPLLFVLFSCGNGQKEALENRIRQIHGMIALFQNHADSRAAAISNISTLSPAKKEEYHYDSLVRVQELQVNAIKVFQKQEDSLKRALDALK
jgi:hypothetical protein